MSRRFLTLSLFFLLVRMTQAAGPDYAIVCSDECADAPEWQAVTAALEKKYPQAERVVYPKGQPAAAREKLAALHPRYACFVAPYADVTTEFVAAVHQLMRKLDDDPYADALWGILTGYDAANALMIAQTSAPLRIERVASGTDVALDRCQEGIWFCELEKNRAERKLPGEPPAAEKGPDDTTRSLADTLTDYKAQLFVTSGHATERDWQIGFRYRNGQFRSKAGQLFGHPLSGDHFPIAAPEPKVYMPIGNCLMGHIDGPDAMALAWMNSAGVRQMLGYTVPTWFGYSGWGCLDYFVEQPGRYSFAEAFFANQAALIHRLETQHANIARTPLSTPDDAMQQRGKVKSQEALGLLFDRDAVAFYGDPAWQARMADGPLAYGQTLKEDGNGTYVFTVSPNEGATSFDPVNTNGSQRGGRPFVHYFSQRMQNMKIIDGSDWHPVVTDDFILVPNPGNDAAAAGVVIRFTAEPLPEKS